MTAAPAPVSWTDYTSTPSSGNLHRRLPHPPKSAASVALMHYPQIGLTVDGSFWKLRNPYLPASFVAPARRPRTPLYAGAAAAASGTVIGSTALLASAAAPTAFTAAGIGAVGAAAAVFTWLNHRWQKATGDRDRARAALTSTLGADHLTRSDFTEPELRSHCDRAVDSAAAIVRSAAFSQGTLGDPDVVGADLQEALWGIVNDLSDLDSRSHDFRRAEVAIALHHRAQDEDVADSVLTELAADVAPLIAQIHDLAALAAQAEALDARLAGQQIDADLAKSLNAPRPDVSNSALDRVAGSLAAGSDVLDADGLH